MSTQQLSFYNIDMRRIDIPSANYETIIQAFHAIDSHWRLMVAFIGSQSKEVLSIAGCLNPMDRVRVSYMLLPLGSNTLHYQLVDLLQLDNTATFTLVNTPDMISEYPIWESVTRDIALQVLEGFTHTSKLPQGFHWKDVKTENIVGI